MLRKSPSFKEYMIDVFIHYIPPYFTKIERTKRESSPRFNCFSRVNFFFFFYANANVKKVPSSLSLRFPALDCVIRNPCLILHHLSSSPKW